MKGNIYFCCLQVFFLAWTSGQAATITLDVSKTSSYVLGDVIPGLTGGGQEGRDQTMVNQLVGIYNGTISPAAPYFLSGNNFGSTLGQAITTGDIVTAAGGIVKAQDGNATLTLGSGFTYLIAQYDGPNGGAVVWDIAGLASSTILEFPWYAQPDAAGDDLEPGQYGISTWTLFDAGPVPPRTHDSGATALLLGAALFGLGLIRRKLS